MPRISVDQDYREESNKGNEMPKRCMDCKTAFPRLYNGTHYRRCQMSIRGEDSHNRPVWIPGPDCPYRRIAELEKQIAEMDAENTRLLEEVVQAEDALAEALKMKCPLAKGFDDHGIFQCALKDKKAEEPPKDCQHWWVNANTIYATDPPQLDRICKKCGRMETVVMEGYTNPYQYRETVEKFRQAKETDDGQ